MVTMSRRGDLDLNREPAQTAAALWESLKGGLRQEMLRHEIIFKNQVRELHRLYWTQKNLMSEMRWKQSASVSAAKSRCGSAEANEEVGGVLLPQGISPEFRVSRHRGFDLEVPAMDLHSEPAREVTDELFEVKGPGSDRSDAAGVGRGGGNCHNGDTDRGLSYGNERFVIDLEAPVEMCHIEEAGAICSSGLKSLKDGGANVNGSRVDAFSGFILTTGFQKDSSRQPSDEKYSNNQQMEKWLKESSAHTDSGPSGLSTISFQSVNPNRQKCQPTTKCLDIDLNIAQDGPSADVCSEPLQKFHSPSARSLVVIDGDQWRKSNCEYHSNAEPSSKYQTQPNSVLPDLELNGSEEWMRSGLKEGHNFIRQTSELSSTVRENAWGYEKSSLDTEVDRSGTGRPVEYCRNSGVSSLSNGTGRPVEYCRNSGMSSLSNGRTQNSANGSIISFIELDKHGDEKVVPLLCQQQVSMHIVSRSETSNVASSNEIEENCLHPSTESTTLIPSTDGVPGRKPTLHAKNEEDTVSSRAISSCEHQGDYLKRLCSNNGAPAPETSGICLDGRSFDICVSNPEEGDQQQTPVRELDVLIFNAADTLVSMSFQNPGSPFNFNSEGQVELGNDEAKSQPQFSLDSFEEMTLRLEEIKDDGSSVTSKQLEKESGTESCGIKLRRGRGLRDFQKDILPGLVSLSRHEICEDIHTIKQELRKIRSHNTGEESFLSPVRTRRSRIYNACRRT